MSAGLQEVRRELQRSKDVAADVAADAEELRGSMDSTALHAANHLAQLEMEADGLRAEREGLKARREELRAQSKLLEVGGG